MPNETKTKYPAKIILRQSSPRPYGADVHSAMAIMVINKSKGVKNKDIRGTAKGYSLKMANTS